MAGNIFANIAGSILESIVKGAATKAAQALVAQGKLTPAEEAPFVEGLMLDVKVGLEEYQSASQKKA